MHFAAFQYTDNSRNTLLPPGRESTAPLPTSLGTWQLSSSGPHLLHGELPASGNLLARCFDDFMLKGPGEEEAASAPEVMVTYKHDRVGAATPVEFLTCEGTFPPKCGMACCPSSKKDRQISDGFFLLWRQPVPQ